MSKKDLASAFKNPGPEYRSAPFWSWNGIMEPDEVCRQLAEMKKGGYGGAFLHSRVGLVTEYLSSEWMAAVRAAVDYCRNNGLLAYLYDEDRWPSGFAGGRVTRRKENWMQALASVRDKKGRISFRAGYAPKTLWFNNLPYLNTLKKEAVADFIASTHEVYRREFSKEFGRTIPAIFTDEPNYFQGFQPGNEIATNSVPWTGGLPEAFQAKYGYDLEPNYPAIFNRTGDWRKVRYHYRRLAAELFQQNFGRQIYDWCGRNNLPLTGHYLAEDNLAYQITVIGAAMPLYEYMQIPGVDHLCNNIRDPLTLKQCSSVSHQLGRPRVLSELFGVSGQNMTFLDRKWIGDWHFSLGINLFCPHLYLYSMAGCRKRDYPPTLSGQQPYWPDNKPLEDYFARTAALLSQGRFAADVLLLHPIESGFILFEPVGSGEENRELREFNARFTALLDDLLAEHFEFDLGDETILAGHGKVSNGKIHVGQISYRAVILPELITIRRSTFNLLLKFIKQGGRVLSLKKLPDLVDGEKDAPALAALVKNVEIFPDINRLLAELNVVLSERIRVRDGQAEAKSVYLYRKILPAGKEAVFLANTDRQNSRTIDLVLPKSGFLEEWNAFTGGITTAEVEKAGKGTKKSVDLPAGGSCLLVFYPGRQPVLSKGRRQEPALLADISTRDWKAEPLGLNSLTLDVCSFRLDNKPWQKPEPVLKIQKILEASGNPASVQLRFGFETGLEKKPTEMYLVMERPEQFEIKVNGIKCSSPLAGKPTKLNSSPLRGEARWGWWIDPAFRKIDIRELIRLKGENTVELTTKFRLPRKPDTLIYRKHGTELEAVYLLGDFRVAGDFQKVMDGFWARNFVLTASSEAGPEALTENGYPFFAGRFRYSGKINLSPRPFLPPTRDEITAKHSSPLAGEVRLGGSVVPRLFLQLVEPTALTHRVRINGKYAGLIYLPPYRLDLTGLLKPGENQIELEAATSLRNLLGPHHNKLAESLVWTGPDSFTDEANWVKDYHVVPVGLKGIRIYTTW